MWTSRAGILLASAILAGCSDATSSGSGHVEALIADLPGGVIDVEGTVQGNIFASISSDGTNWVNLGSPNGITIALQTTGAGTTVHGEQDAPADTYVRVRLVFSGVTVTLQSGSTVGGVTLTSDATLHLGGSDHQVEVSILVPSFQVENSDGIRRTIAFDLRSHFWITAAALQAGLVEDAALQGAVIGSTEETAR